MKNAQKFLLGFNSPSDFLGTIFGAKAFMFNIWLSGVAALTTFITDYVWDSSHAVYALLSLMIFDWVLGVYLSVRATMLLRYCGDQLSEEKKIEYNRRRFSSKKFPRIFVAIIISFWLLSVAWNLSKASLFFVWLPGVIYGGFTGTYVISMWENLTEMGFFSKEILILVKEKLDPTKFFKK